MKILLSLGLAECWRLTSLQAGKVEMLSFESSGGLKVGVSVERSCLELCAL